MGNAEAQVYITKTGEKYHTKKCRFLKYSKKEISLKKAIEYGYKACRVCKPQKVTSKKTNNLYNTKKHTVNKRGQSVQCTGKTKSGRRCKRRTKKSNSRCYQH